MSNCTSYLRLVADKSAFVFTIAILLASQLFAQQVVRKPQRAKPPVLSQEDFQGVFFDNVTEHLVGKPPEEGTGVSSSSGAESSTSMANSNSDSGGTESIWKERISPQSIEDLVKETKLRLDGIVTTPAKFSGGAFKDARRDFTLLATLFTVVELYPEKVRWQASAPVARARFSRVAANTKVGSTAAYNEAKLRLDDMNSMLKGGSLTDPAPKSDIAWDEVADRIPSMQLLEWSLRENLTRFVSSEDSFKQSPEEIVKFAELISLLGETLCQPGMTDGSDADYQAFAKRMVEESSKVSQAVKLNNPSMAREAAGQIDQACNACHSAYR